MTPVNLLDCLQEFVEAKTADIKLQVRVDNTDPEQEKERAAGVYKMRLPKKEDNIQKIPYILLQFLTGKDDKENGEPEESTCKVRIVVATCQTSGIVGNEIAVGQIKEIVDVYEYYLKIENITKTSGGAEREGDEEYYERMRESMESFSTAGPVNGYIYHAKSVSAAVADVAATSPVPGVVDVRILLQDSKQPTEAVLKEIEEALSADDVRPLTDLVMVSAPEEDPFEIDVTFYIERNTQASSSIIDIAARQAVEKYIKWQTSKMGRDINPSYLVQKMMDAGIKRVEVRKPEFKVVEETHVAKIVRETIQVLNGGVENE